MGIDARRIAKNTVFLYARMLLTMGVTLYTSRVVLEVLGADDYGLYFTIFSIIGMLSFLNGTLSGGTSRFITFELGKGNLEDLKATFSTTVYTHLMLALIILILGETVGLWYAYDILKVPDHQRQAAIIVYQISILITILTIVQIPFTAEIIAHERMNVYAYLGIFEAGAKLAIVYLLVNTPFVKIILYGWLQAGVTIILFFFYLIYCRLNFKEISFKNRFRKSIFKSMLGFSGWNLLANVTNTLMRQGVIMLFNYFFSPVVVAAQAISNQISQAAGQFVNNIRQAVNPQIIKLYAEGNETQSQTLTLKSAEYVYYLLLLIGVPCIMVMPRLLSIWLKEVPEYAVPFAQLMVLQLILDNFNSAFYIPLMAANKMDKNAIWGSLLIVGQFVSIWLLFHFGLGPLWARYLSVFSICILSFVIKPYLLRKQVNYPLTKIMKCLMDCAKISIPILIINVLIYISIPQTDFWYSLIVALFSALTVICCSYFAIGSQMREKIRKITLNYIGKFK